MWGTWHLLCSVLQFKTWHGLLKREIGDVVDLSKDEDVLMSNDLPNQKITNCGVQAKALHYLRAPCIHESDLQSRCLFHFYVAD